MNFTTDWIVVHRHSRQRRAQGMCCNLGRVIPRVPRSISCSRSHETRERPGASSRRLWPRLIIPDRASSLWMAILPIRPSFRN
jgi:hypothetical protein